MKTKRIRPEGIVFTNADPRYAGKLDDPQGGDVTMLGSSRIFGDSSVTIAQWWRARHSRNVVIRKVPGSIPAENTSPQIHMDLST